MMGAMALSASRVHGANSSVRVAMVGMGWWGAQMGPGSVGRFAKVNNVRVVALCDPDREHLDNAAKKYEKALGKVDLETDYRRLLERTDIDAVVLTTPNHWHALQTIWACQAGKDVYVEKPCSHTVWEGQQMVAAARRYNRIVQVGLQVSSLNCLPELTDWLRAGNLGAIQTIHAVWYRQRDSIGKRATPLQPPASLDYNLWLGPAQDIPIYRDQLHYDWHWVWNTGNGEIANLGAHTVDLARRVLGQAELDGPVTSFGQRFQWDDAGETPNMQVAYYRLGGIPVIHEINDFPVAAASKALPAFKGIRQGVVVLCEGGHFMGHGQGKAFDKNGKVVKKFSGRTNHEANFIQAIQSRKRETLHCEVEEGFASSRLPLLAGIAHRVGEPVSVNQLEAITGADPQLHDAFTRYQKQAEQLGFDLEKEPWILGPGLKYDLESGRFAGEGEQVAAAECTPPGAGLSRAVCRAGAGLILLAIFLNPPAACIVVGLNALALALSGEVSFIYSMMKLVALLSALILSLPLLAAERPNIILVMADDQGWGDTGYNGHDFAVTENLDGMAKDGFVFDRFYAAVPVCSPTRASVLTGRNPIRSRVPSYGNYLRPQEKTLAEVLKEAGYVTGIFGKLHIGSGQKDTPCNPSGMGFDEWVIGAQLFRPQPLPEPERNH